jgi:hypothetical protein
MKAIQFLSELSTDLLARYKKAAYSDAKKADAEGDYERGNKRFKGINKATVKQFDNDLKKHDQQDTVEGTLTNIVKNTSQSAVDALLKKHGWSIGKTVNGDLAMAWQGSTYVFYGERMRINWPNGQSVSVVWGKKPDWQGRGNEVSYAQAVQKKYLTFDLPIWQALDRGQINDTQAIQRFKAENERQAKEAVSQSKNEGIFDSKPKVDFKARAKELFASGLTEQQVLQQLIKEGCPPRQAAVFVQGAQLESISEWLAEEGKASRALCQGGKPDSQLGASQLASCKSQGLRARDGDKSHLIGHEGSKVRVTVGGKKIKGKKYGGPLPDYGTRKGQQ